MHLIFAGILALLYFSLFIMERRWPLRKPTRPVLPRLMVNLSFTVLVYIIASLLISPLANFTINQTKTHKIGLLALLPFDQISIFVIGFLLMDLTFYYWHRLNHVIPWLWRFHNVHHADPDLDITTSMRFHVVEVTYSSIFRVIQLGLLGINPLTFLCYEFVFQANTFLHHSNLKLPFRFEKLINKLLVTPRMHGIHHSNYQNETNRNYGVVFSFWDRLHNTIKLNIPQKIITIGIPAYHESRDNRFINLLLMPFKRQRPYWLLPFEDHHNRKQPPHEDKDCLAE